MHFTNMSSNKHPTKIRRSSRRKFNDELGGKLRKNAGRASEAAYTNLATQEVIDPHLVMRKEDHGGLYPVEITGNKKCHLRALYNISRDACNEATSLKLQACDYVKIKDIAKKYVISSKGAVFCVRKNDNTDRHWVAVTPSMYFDDAYCRNVINYDGAVAVLELMEFSDTTFGGIHTSAISQNEVFQERTQAEVGDKEANSRNCEVGTIRGGGDKINSDNHDVGSLAGVVNEKAYDVDRLIQSLVKKCSIGIGDQHATSQFNWHGFGWQVGLCFNFVPSDVYFLYGPLKTDDNEESNKVNETTVKTRSTAVLKKRKKPDEKDNSEIDDVESNEKANEESNKVNETTVKTRSTAVMNPPVPPYKLLVGVSRKGKSFINCLPISQQTGKKQSGNIDLFDKFTEFHQARLGEIIEDPGQIITISDSADIVVMPSNTAELEKMLPQSHDKLSLTKFLNFVGIMSGLCTLLMEQKSSHEFCHLDLMFGKLHHCIDFGHGTDLRLSCFSQMSSSILFSPTFSNCPHLKQVAEATVGSSTNDKMLIIVHGPKSMRQDEINDCILSGSFLQIFDWVCCITFSWSIADEEIKLDVQSRTNTDYNGCGNCKEFLIALAQGYCISKVNKSMTISMKEHTVEIGKDGYCIINETSSFSSISPFVKSSMAIEMLKDHIIRRKDFVLDTDTCWSHRKGLESSLDDVFGTQSIVVDHSEGCHGISMDAVLGNVYELGRSLWERKYSNIQSGIKWARMSNHVERVCLMAVIVYQSPTSLSPDGFQYRLACRLCKKDIHIPSEGSYDTLHNAMMAAPLASIIHRLIKPFGPGFFKRSDHVEPFPGIGDHTYRLHGGNIPVEDNPSINPCCPDKMGHDSCLGDDQLLLSMIANDDESLQQHQTALWSDIMRSIINSDKAEDAHGQLEKRLTSLRNGKKRAERRLPETLSEHKILEDYSDSWNPIEKSLQMSLLHKAKFVMEVDWQHDSFPKSIPDDFTSLNHSDRNILNRLLKDGSNNFKLFHQLGVLFVDKYVEIADSNSHHANLYRKIPCIAYPFAFECSNRCKNIWRREGRAISVPSKLYVIRSYYNKLSDLEKEFQDIIKKDKGFDFGVLDNKKTFVDWIADIGLIGGPNSQISIKNGHKQFMNSLNHGEWTSLPRNISTALKTFCKKEQLQWRRSGVCLMNLHPYQAGSYMMMKQAIINTHHPGYLTANLGLADLQSTLSAAFCHGTIPHEKELERMTNACFQGSTSNDSNGQKVTQMLNRVDRVQTKGCAFPKTSSPRGISGSRTLPVKVSADVWNCVCGNAINLMDCLDQYDFDVKKAIAFVQTLGQSDGGNIFGKLKDAIRGVKYSIICLPEGLNYKDLTEYVQQLQLPILVSLSVNYGADSYDHVVGICPYKDLGGGDAHFRIVDGAHPDLQCIEYSSQNLDWCCGVGNQFTVTTDGFAFIPSPRRTITLLKHMQEGGHNRIGTTVCLNIEGTSNKIPQKLKDMNIVRKEISDYYKITKVINEGSRKK